MAFVTALRDTHEFITRSVMSTLGGIVLITLRVMAFVTALRDTHEFITRSVMSTLGGIVLITLRVMAFVTHYAIHMSLSRGA